MAVLLHFVLVVVCVSESFGMNFLSRDILLKLCLINPRSVKAGQKDSAKPLTKHTDITYLAPNQPYIFECMGCVRPKT